MKYTIIEVPDKNDSISRITLLGKQYHIRFTWNDTADYWSFGISDSLESPLVIGTKILPNYPLNLFWGNDETPFGVFAALTKVKNVENVGRDDFTSGKARFVFIPAN